MKSQEYIQRKEEFEKKKKDFYDSGNFEGFNKKIAIISDYHGRKNEGLDKEFEKILNKENIEVIFDLGDLENLPIQRSLEALEDENKFYMLITDRQIPYKNIFAKHDLTLMEMEFNLKKISEVKQISKKSNIPALLLCGHEHQQYLIQGSEMCPWGGIRLRINEDRKGIKLENKLYRLNSGKFSEGYFSILDLNDCIVELLRI